MKQPKGSRLGKQAAKGYSLAVDKTNGSYYLPETPAEPASITNAAFLSALFPSGFCWITDFRENPAAASASWAGRLCLPAEAKDTSDKNSYFSVASFSEHATTRSYANFVQLNVLVLDDPQGCSLEPSWRLRTSPDKFQIGYRLTEPVTDIEVAKRLHQELAQNGNIPVDRSGNNPVRYVRLPVGANTKRNPPFPCVLETFQPELLYTLDELVESLGLNAAYILHGGHQPPKVALGAGDIIPEGARNTTLTSYAGSMRRPGMSQEAIEAALLVENARRCCPPLDDQEVRGIARSVSRYAPAETVSGERKTPVATAVDDIFEDIGAEEPKPIRWAIRDYFEAAGVSLVFGPSGSYKTFLVLGVAFSTATGLPWHGHAVMQSGTVLYFAGEGRNNIRRRVKALCARYGVEYATLKIKLIRTDKIRNLIDSEFVELLKASIEALPEPPALVIIDTLAKSFGKGDENSTKDMNGFISNIDFVRGETGVIIVHHTGHSFSDRERGASSLGSGVDARYLAEYKDGTVTVTAKKMKDAELPPPLNLMPKKIELPFKEGDGSTATSVVLETGADQIALRKKKFHEKYPGLKEGKRIDYMPQLLEMLYDEKTFKQADTAKKLKIAPATLSQVLVVLRNYELLEKETYRLTEEGTEAAAILSPHRVDIAKRWAMRDV